MRTIVLLMTLVVIPLYSGAQVTYKNRLKKNEIGLTLLRTISFNSNYGYSTLYSSTPYISFLNGIVYKRIFSKNAIRIGAEYHGRNDRGVGDFIGTSSYREGRFIVGYQRLLLDKVIKPYFGSDLTFIYAKFQHEFSGGLWAAYKMEDLKYTGLGITPLLGFKVQIFKMLSISLESNVEFLLISKMGNQIKNSPEDVNGRVTNSIHTTEFIKRINPLNILSINFSF